VDCPDLTAPPFYLAAPGFGGNPKSVEVGSPTYLAPLPQKHRKYDIAEVLKACNSSNGFAIGPGAGPYHEFGQNCEMMANVYFGKTPPVIGTRVAWINENNTYSVAPFSKNAEFALMGNFLVTDGKPGTPVIKVNASQRKGKDDFITTLKKALQEKYGERPVGVGGVFLVKSGKVNMHVMPEFSKVPLNSDKEVNEWLRYFEMDAPLVCLSLFYSHDPGLALRMDHSHCFSKDGGRGGHYHYDVSPDTVEYEGYFTLTEQIIRIDKP